MNRKNPLFIVILTALLGTQGTVHGAPLAISDTPLSVSTAVEPNVMLLIDNSGSMAQIMWHKDYDPATTYPGSRGPSTWYGFNKKEQWVDVTGKRLKIPGPSKDATPPMRRESYGAVGS
jgi:type IV pilus assembly protein PilY1